MMAADGRERERLPMCHLFLTMGRMHERLGITIWYFQGEIELEAAFFLIFMDGTIKAQEDVYVE